jgi:hypothetical protein
MTVSVCDALISQYEDAKALAPSFWVQALLVLAAFKNIVIAASPLVWFLWNKRRHHSVLAANQRQREHYDSFLPGHVPTSLWRLVTWTNGIDTLIRSHGRSYLACTISKPRSPAYRKEMLV